MLVLSLVIHLNPLILAFCCRFHFPLGNPATSTSGDLTKFADEFRKHKNSCVSVEELGQILKVSNFKKHTLILCITYFIGSSRCFTMHFVYYWFGKDDTSRAELQGQIQVASVASDQTSDDMPLPRWSFQQMHNF